MTKSHYMIFFLILSATMLLFICHESSNQMHHPQRETGPTNQTKLQKPLQGCNGLQLWVIASSVHDVWCNDNSKKMQLLLPIRVAVVFVRCLPNPTELRTWASSTKKIARKGSNMGRRLMNMSLSQYNIGTFLQSCLYYIECILQYNYNFVVFLLLA